MSSDTVGKELRSPNDIHLFISVIWLKDLPDSSLIIVSDEQLSRANLEEALASQFS